MEELTLQLSHLIFSMIKCTYVAYLKVDMRFVFAIDGLFIFMAYWTEVYSVPCKISKIELSVKTVNYF